VLLLKYDIVGSHKILLLAFNFFNSFARALHYLVPTPNTKNNPNVRNNLKN